MITRLRQVCPHCKGEDITKDTLARWSVPDQVWEISCELGYGDCNDCGAEFATPLEVEADLVGGAP